MYRKTLQRCFSTYQGIPPKHVADYLKTIGLRNKRVKYQLPVSEYYRVGLHEVGPNDPDTRPPMISETGAYVAYSGAKTGRTPKDKRVVKDEKTENMIWWGDVNIPLEPSSYKTLEERCLDWLNVSPQVYILDGYAGADPRFRIKVRVICTRSYHALFMNNMLIVPTREELETDWKNGPDYLILNGGEFPAAKTIKGVTTKTCVTLNPSAKRLVILGTQYAGEMKKGVFSIMHTLMPDRGILSLHASCNEGPKGDTTLLFGLSGTGKTTLSADPHRSLIGDDEHCWSEEGIFNIEGGCYAKCINLSPEKEPEIFNAIRYGSVLENVLFHESGDHRVNFADNSITENTRVSYPLQFIPGAKIPSIGGHPKNIFFLTCDAWGVLPPVSKLTHEQAMYHFIMGYTAKVAGTEMGVTEPTETFSACFGEAFLTRHPSIYAEMLAQKMLKHKTNAWLINTGWSGGKYGVGKRMDINTTRAIIDAIHSGQLEKVPTKPLELFNIGVPEFCPGVDNKILNPINTWADKNDYHNTIKKLAGNFIKSFKKYEDKASATIKNAGPQL